MISDSVPYLDCGSLWSDIGEADVDVLANIANTNPEAKREFLEDPSLERPNNRYEGCKGFLKVHFLSKRA